MDTKRIKRRTKIGAPDLVLTVNHPSKVAVRVDENGTVMVTMDAADIDTMQSAGKDMATRAHNATAATD